MEGLAGIIKVRKKARIIVRYAQLMVVPLIYLYIRNTQPCSYQLSKGKVHEIKFADSCHVNINNLTYSDRYFNSLLAV